MTTYTLRRGAAEKTGTDALVVGVVETAKGPRLAAGAAGVAEAYGRKLAPLLSQLGLTGKEGQVTAIPTAGVVRSPLLVLAGLGAQSDLDPSRVRRAAGAAARALHNSASVALALPAEDPAHVQAATEGFLLGCYTYDAYRSDADRPRLAEVVVLSDGARRGEMAEAFETAQVVAAAVATTRDWVNTPPGDLTPARFADEIVELNQGRGGAAVTVTVLDEVELAATGCGGIIGVGQGSASPPRLVRLGYEPPEARTHLALVGKGVTYDSGGLSIKPGAAMMTMKLDMAGAAAVAAATFAIADLGLPVRVSAFAPMAENMLSGSAMRPGDVLTMYGGRTVEVLNTDAEGRLILADALGQAVELEPDVVVDVATLTGACVMALGDRVTGLFGNDEGLLDALRLASDRAGERLWQLPIPEEMAEKVRTGSKVADLAQHNVDRWGGALYAAAFLREFVGDARWAHLDIAGPAFNDKDAYGHVQRGGTGAMVATLVQLARDLAEPTDPAEG